MCTLKETYIAIKKPSDAHAGMAKGGICFTCFCFSVTIKILFAVFGRALYNYICKYGSPLGSGFQSKRKTPRLSVMPRTLVLAFNSFDDRACAVCYFCYMRKYLKKEERRALFLIAKNCECDFADVKDGKPENENRFFENSSASPTNMSVEA